MKSIFSVHGMSNRKKITFPNLLHKELLQQRFLKFLSFYFTLGDSNFKTVLPLLSGRKGQIATLLVLTQFTEKAEQQQQQNHQHCMCID
jgi:hypothetical protein